MLQHNESTELGADPLDVVSGLAPIAHPVVVEMKVTDAIENARSGGTVVVVALVVGGGELVEVETA